MAKGIIVSDIHLGDYSYGRTDPETGLNTRFLDFLSNLDQSIDFAIDHKVDFFFVDGDIYRNKHPNSKIRKQFALKIKRLIQNNKSIRVILMTGNHDMTTSSDGAHAMSEMEELCDLIDGLEVYSSPTIVEIDSDTELYILPYVNRSEHQLLTVQELLAFQIAKIKEFNKLTHKSKAKNKLFFGHFGTNKSVVGSSFDLDMSDDENENVVQVELFDEGDWTQVYLGHIHKQQALDKHGIVKHIGSIGRVDFAEQDEEKGFYFYKNGPDEFVTVKDRIFKTFFLKLEADHQVKIAALLEKLQKVDLSTAIVKVKAEIKQTYYSEARLDLIETYLKEHSWHSVGIDISIIPDQIDQDVAQITTEDSPDEALRKFIEKNTDRFANIEEEAFKIGCESLKLVNDK
jgi:DNA repair protein SbcD/Mre11